LRTAGALVVALVGALVTGCGDAGQTSGAGVPECEASGELVTIAQAVPTATFVPCIEALPVGWSFGDMEVRDGRASFTLSNDRAGVRSVEVTLEATCDTSDATELSGSGRPHRFLRVDELSTRRRGAWLHRFPGGCVTYGFSVPTDTYDFDAFNVELETALGFFSRRTIAADVMRRYGAELDGSTAAT
jgi:hypothetical protein